MRIYLHAMKRASIQNIKHHTPETRRRKARLDGENVAAVRSILADMRSGAVSYAYTRRKGEMAVVTPSTRCDGWQVTFFELMRGEWCAMSHETEHDASGVDRWLHHGCYFCAVV